MLTESYLTCVLETPFGQHEHIVQVVNVGRADGATQALIFTRGASFVTLEVAPARNNFISLSKAARVRTRGQPLRAIHSACWDAYTGCIYALTDSMLVRVSTDGEATRVVGRLRGSANLMSDGEGCLYLLDQGRLRRLQLPLAWKGAGVPVVVAPGVGGGDSGEQQQQGKRKGLEQGKDGEECGEDAEGAEGESEEGEGAEGESEESESAEDGSAEGESEEDADKEGDGEVQVSTVSCGRLDGRLRYAAYDPASRSLVLCTWSAAYRLPVEGLGADSAAVHEPVLLAGREGAQGDEGDVDEDGDREDFTYILGVAVDGGGCVWLPSYRLYLPMGATDKYMDELDIEDPETQLLRVGPGGQVATVADELWESGRAEGCCGRPAVLGNGCLALVDDARVLLLHLGLTMPGEGPGGLARGRPCDGGPDDEPEAKRRRQQE